MSVIAEIESSLQALRALKAPGVTKSRITSITTLCVENVKSEILIVQKIHENYKKTPATHKLGVLYVVDSVTRAWLEKSSSTGEQFSAAPAPDGTFASGVHRVTGYLPSWMNDLITSAPEDQKEKITKLIDIWERGNVFPLETLSDFKTKLASRPIPPQSITLTGISPGDLPRSAATTMDQRPSRPPPTEAYAQDILTGLTSLSQQAMVAPIPTVATQSFVPTNGHTVVPVVTSAPETAPSNDVQTQVELLKSVIPPHIASNPALIPQYLQLLQQLAERGVPPDQWNLVISILQEQQVNQPPPVFNPPTQERRRSRSPSLHHGNPGNAQDYRQRTPLRAASPSLQQDEISLNGGAKWSDYDPSIPNGCIKVFSRTLFIGGVNGPEEELRQIFSRFGTVQTCIVNREKRHAFVKMCDRRGALAAREGMEKEQDPIILSRARSTKWGVGFGPRECNDYQTGVSIIPIDRLTEADLKWVHSAEYGGIGNKALVSGIVMEEPDIEIGAGVSSKAISRRVVSGGAPSNAHRSTPPSNRGSSQHRGRRQNNSGPSTPASVPSQYRPAVSTLASPPLGVPPTVPGFGFQFPGNGGLQY